MRGRGRGAPGGALPGPPKLPGTPGLSAPRVRPGLGSRPASGAGSRGPAGRRAAVQDFFRGRGWRGVRRPDPGRRPRTRGHRKPPRGAPGGARPGDQRLPPPASSGAAERGAPAPTWRRPRAELRLQRPALAQVSAESELKYQNL
ncbi:small nuclear ribonucleoprotein-associated protein B'-like [Choloepus didactylus]|uniref:small nuclear ribonucleoprotein-associated protein B'-like n=1 Tax=Choloepus didactylus TaxID=27675 RepID=UPI00189C84C5|nr:small nuclear ribonucleoprotein-associated protein B'-like [Choloepus didactylus]